MRRLIFFVLLIVVLLAGVISFPFLLHPEKQRAKIETALSLLLQRPVVIGECSMGYLPPTLRVKRLAVLNQQKEAFIEAASASAPLSLKDLVQLKFIPESVVLEGWSVTISRKVNGSWDYVDWWPRENGISSAKSWTLKHIQWKQGTIRWVDMYASAPQEITLGVTNGSWNPRPETLEAQGSFTGALAGVGAKLALRGKFFGTPQWTGDLEITDQGNVFSTRLSQSTSGFEMKAQTAKWRLSVASAVLQFLARFPMQPADASTLAIENWNLSAKGNGTQMTFEQTAQIGGGQTESKGSFAPRADGAVFRMQGAASAVPVEAICLLAGEQISATGKITGITKDFSMVISSRTSSTVHGQGYVEVKDGQYRPPEMSIKKLAKAKMIGYVKKKYPDFMTSGLPFSRLSAHWQAKNGTLTADNGLLVTPTIKAGWVGHINLARKGMDGFIRLDMKEKDASLKALIPAKYHQQPAYGRLQGNWNEWALRATTASKIPAGTRAQLSKAVAQK